MLEITLSYLQNGNKRETLGSKEKRERQAISLRAFELAGFGSPSKRCHQNGVSYLYNSHIGAGVPQGEVEVILRPQAIQHLKRLVGVPQLQEVPPTGATRSAWKIVERKTSR